MATAADVRITLRPIATPMALGMAAILLGSAMLSGLQLGWISGADQQQTVGVVALAGAFPLELLAAILAFLARDALAGTALGTFSAVWAVTGVSLLSAQPGQTNDALGMFLVLASTLLALLLVSLGVSRLLLGVMLTTGCTRLLLTGLFQIKGSSGLEDAAGIVGLALAAICAYGIVALLQEDLPRRSFLPVGRSGRAESSVGGGLQDQVAGLEHEAGVRRLL